MISLSVRLLLIATLCCSPFALAETTLFEVSDGDSRVLIGGTIHLLHPEEFPLPEAFDEAYREADSLYLETNLEAVETPAFGQRLARAMLYPAGKTLRSELDPEVWEQVERYSEANQFPIQQFIGFDPAFVSIVMTVMKAQSEGITAGVDTHFYQKAKRDGKPIGQLETAEDVLAYMKAITGLDGNAIMTATLLDLERFDQLLETTVSAWKRGDLDAIDRDLGRPMREEAPELYRSLLVERNARWLERIVPLFEQQGVELILVGSLHLAGKESLLELLAQRGYEIRAYPPE